MQGFPQALAGACDQRDMGDGDAPLPKSHWLQTCYHGGESSLVILIPTCSCLPCVSDMLLHCLCCCAAFCSPVVITPAALSIRDLLVFPSAFTSGFLLDSCKRDACCTNIHYGSMTKQPPVLKHAVSVLACGTRSRQWASRERGSHAAFASSS